MMLILASPFLCNFQRARFQMKEVILRLIIHLDCRSPDGRVRTKQASQLIQCDRKTVICVHTIDHSDTSLLLQHQFSVSLLQCAVTSCRVCVHISCVVPLPLTPMRRRQTFEGEKITI